MLTNQEAIELLKGIQKEEEDSLRDLGVEAISLAIKALSEPKVAVFTENGNAEELKEELENVLETPTAEWEEEHEVSCGNILRWRANVIEHKCNNCKRWGIRWAGTIPDKYCPNCGAPMQKGGVE